MKRFAQKMCAALLLALAASHVSAQTCRDPETLRFAVIPQMKDMTSFGQYDALIETLAKELSRDVRLVPVVSYGAVIEGMVDGSVDLAELGPGSYALARDRGAAITAFASLHRQGDAIGASSYQSVLITRRDTRIHSLDQLRGSSVSLVDPASTSGGIVPRAMLQRTRGMPLEAWFGRVSFAGSHDAAIDVVLNGRVDAAFVSSNRVDGVVRSGRVAPDTLHVVWRSAPIPHDPFVYQADLCQPVKDAIHRVFFERQNDLKALFVARGMGSFVPVSESDYQHLMQRPIDVP